MTAAYPSSATPSQSHSQSRTQAASTPPHTEVASLELANIVHGYGERTVVRDVSLSLQAGELICLLGPSGCGKTTTLRIAAGLEHPWQGEVRMGGQVVADATRQLPPERRHIGFLFQDFALFPHLSVIDNVMFGIRHLKPDARRAQARAKLAMVGMADYEAAFPHTLSGGQQQRVALARALAPEPRLMLLDEPFSGLDARLRQQIRAETFQVLQENGVAAVMVTHDPEEAMFMADRIALMDRGVIVQYGPPSTLYHRPATPFAARFFGEINELPGVVRGGQAETPIGPLPAPHLTDGSAALCMLRPEAFVLSTGAAAQGKPQARVISIRPLGRINKVTLGIPASGGEMAVMAHVHDLPAISAGDSVGIGLLADEVFVFAGA